MAWEQIRAFITEIKKTDIKGKIKLIKEADGNIRDWLEFMYNPAFVTGIGDKLVIQPGIGTANVYNIYTYEYFLYFLKNNCSSLRASVSSVLAYAEQCRQEYDDEIYDIVVATITKNLKIGISCETINKAIPKLIPDLKIMLAHTYAKNIEYVQNRVEIGNTFTLTLKMDGNRCVMYIKSIGNGEYDVKCVSRNNKVIDGIEHIIDRIIPVIDANAGTEPVEIMLDGELIIDNWYQLDNHTAYHLTTKAIKDGPKPNVHYVIFDAVGKLDFRAYKERRAYIEQFATDCVYPVPKLYEGSDLSMVTTLFKEATNSTNSQEGIMLNFNDDAYQPTRTKSILKVKGIEEVDLLCVGIEEGTNSNKGKCGALVCKYKDNTVSVGSGLSKPQRTEFWNNPPISKIIKIEHRGETINDSGIPSLRFPVFKEVRTDKSEPNEE